MNNKQLENLLKITAGHLGTSPEALMQAAKSGQLENMLGNIPENEHLRKVLSDPDAARKLLSAPQAQQLLSKLQGKE